MLITSNLFPAYYFDKKKATTIILYYKSWVYYEKRNKKKTNRTQVHVSYNNRQCGTIAVLVGWLLLLITRSGWCYNGRMWKESSRIQVDSTLMTHVNKHCFWAVFTHVFLLLLISLLKGLRENMPGRSGAALAMEISSDGHKSRFNGCFVSPIRSCDSFDPSWGYLVLKTSSWAAVNDLCPRTPATGPPTPPHHHRSYTPETTIWYHRKPTGTELL